MVTRGEQRQEMNDVDEDYGPFHCLKGLLPWGESFPDHAMDLAADLIMLVSGNCDCRFNRTEVWHIDQFILDSDDSETLCSLINPEFMPKLIAYVREFVRRRVDGTWQMVLTEDGLTWEPRIIGKKGEKHLLDGVHNILFEHREMCSVAGAIEGIIMFPQE